MANGFGLTDLARNEAKDISHVSPELMSDALEAISEGFALFDRDGCLVICNNGLHVLHPRCSPLLVPGISWSVLLHEAELRGDLTAPAAQRLRIAAAHIEAGSQKESFEFGETNGHFLAATLSAMAQGGFVLVLRDITARHQLEAEEREADLILRKVLEACPANVVMSRLGDGEVLYRSPEATDLFGPARSSRDYFASRIEQADFVTDLLSQGRVDNFQCIGTRADGTPFPGSISARLIEYRGEDVIVSSILDLTREKAMQVQLAQQREQIFQAEKLSALGELLAGVAHELNNPLSVVVGHSLMLRDESADADTLRRVEKISEAAERCARIVKSFLALARQQPVRLVPMDVAEMVDMAVDALRNGADGLSTEVEISAEGPLPRVRGDANQLAQIVINLVTNADQAIRDSGIGDRIRIALRHDEPASMIEIVVADNGPGVPQDLHRRIFDPLFTTKPVGSGTGLGLALAHRVATAHDGQIRLDPGSGPGAVFRVRLPTTSEGAAGQREEATGGAGGSRGRILIVDDEPEVAELIREILLGDGFEVEIAESGEAALERLAGRSYSLVLTDLNMPGMGGRGFYERVLRERPAVAARIGFVTGDTMSPQARGFLESARRPFLEKPIAPGELRKLARAMLADVPGAGA